MIVCGDLFDVLPGLAAESIDSCVTDPPYGIGFMGKEWDTFSAEDADDRIVPNRSPDATNPNVAGRSRSPASSPSAVEYDRSIAGQHRFEAWSERWGREVLRVLKPGAYAVVFGAPRAYHRMAAGLEDAGFEVRDCLSWLFGQGFPKSLNLGEGRGTALKPAWEPIVLLRKPTALTLAANIREHAVGGLNIDAGRIEGDPRPARAPGAWFGADDLICESKDDMTEIGRWPTNVALDDVAGAMLDEENGVARFFYVAKPDRAERDRGCAFLPGRLQDGVHTDWRDRTSRPVQNHHPTVKPIDLMRWLVKLITPAAGKVLDPFCGSGSTGCACAYEGRQFLGIERESEYVTIAERRIANCLPLFQDEELPLFRETR